MTAETTKGHRKQVFYPHFEEVCWTTLCNVNCEICRPHFISLKKWNIWEPIYIKNKLGKSRSMWGRTYWGFLHWWLKNRRRWNATVFEAKKYGIVKTVRTFFSWFNTVKQLCISDHCGMGNLGCLRKRGFNFSLASALIYHVILLILFSCECWTRQAYPLCR